MGGGKVRIKRYEAGLLVMPCANIHHKNPLLSARFLTCYDLQCVPENVKNWGIRPVAVSLIPMVM